MKELKKLLCGLVAAMMVFTLAACGEKADEAKEEAKTEEAAPATEAPAEENAVVGKYVAVDATFGEEEMPEDQKEAFAEMLKEFTLDLNEDGTALMNLGEEEPEELEYTVEGDIITLTAEGESVEAKIDDGKIILEMPEEVGGMSIVFEKQ